MTGKQRDVLCSLPQRRQGDGQYVQAVVKILAEGLGLDEGFEVLVGGSDHAHIHVRRLAGAHGPDLSVLHDPQKLGLDRQRDVPDFVQMQGPFVGGGKKPLVITIGTGKSALDVAEEFAFEQVFRNRRTVHRHKRLGGARTEMMDHAGHQLLAGSRFPRTSTVYSDWATAAMVCLSWRMAAPSPTSSPPAS